MALIAAGLLWFHGIATNGSFLADILGPSLLAALGLGFGFVTSTIAAVSGVKDREQGLASGLINTSQQFGGALGLADPLDDRHDPHQPRSGRRRLEPAQRPHRAGSRRRSWPAR